MNFEYNLIACEGEWRDVYIIKKATLIIFSYKCIVS